MTMHALVDLATLTAIPADALPPELAGLDHASLADLSWVGAPLDVIYAGKGYWPLEVSDPALGSTEVLTDNLVGLTPDPVRKVVTATRGKRALTAEEIASIRQAKLAALADRRWRAEEAGTRLPDGTPIATDRVTQGKITAAYIKAKESPTYRLRWKAGPGRFATLDAATIITIAEAVEVHVQAAFDREDTLSTAIMAATDPASVDIETGWPA